MWGVRCPMELNGGERDKIAGFDAVIWETQRNQKGIYDRYYECKGRRRMWIRWRFIFMSKVWVSGSPSQHMESLGNGDIGYWVGIYRMWLFVMGCWREVGTRRSSSQRPMWRSHSLLLITSVSGGEKPTVPRRIHCSCISSLSLASIWSYGQCDIVLQPFLRRDLLYGEKNIRANVVIMARREWHFTLDAQEWKMSCICKAKS